MKRILYFLGALFLFMSCNQEVVNKNEVREYVDLGLSVCWATCNIGATKPEEYGDFFAWGEDNTKNEYNSNNCKTIKKRLLGAIIERNGAFINTPKSQSHLNVNK